jgi:hypothetical protein
MEPLNAMNAQETALFSDIMSSIETAFRLNVNEVQQLMEDHVVRLLALLPHFAGCPDPRATGYLNIVTYIAERRGGKQFFLHLPEHDDEYTARLQIFARIMDGGDPQIIEKGLSLAAVSMINDYILDQEHDQKAGKYNPLNTGRWSAKTALDELSRRIKSCKVPRMDALFTLAIFGATWWQPF